jgi:beclin 1
VALKASRQALYNAACARRDEVQACLDKCSGAAAAAAAAPLPTPPPELLAGLASEEASLAAELAEAEAARARAEARLGRLRRQRAALAALQAGLWATHREVQARLLGGRQAMDALGVACARQREALARLRCLRVQSDAFFIWHSEPFATINGARLGRLPGRVPEWAETNAALGQMALLLSLTAARLNYAFKRWRIIPMGSYSKIGAVDDERASKQELWYDTSAFFPAAKLSSALKPLMVCMAELGAHVEGLDRDKHGGQAQPSFLPHPVSVGGERVGDLPVALSSGKDVPWTRAMRMAATNLKWLVAYAERLDK